LAVIQLKTGSKYKPEASIAEATLTEEVSNFTTKYYDDNIPTRHNPIIHYNAANHEEVPKLSIFVGLGGKSSGAKRTTIKGSEWDLIHAYVLNNMEEVKLYIK
jgi:tartrate dehydratase alpha subunit/fumarate hydratase class I-like protein